MGENNNNNKPKLNPIMEIMMTHSKAFRENYKPMSQTEDRYLATTIPTKGQTQEKKEPTIEQIMEWMGNQRTDF